jgi:CRISPR/Cas system-associated exonuclease Cas4 (RecB family)
MIEIAVQDIIKIKDKMISIVEFIKKGINPKPEWEWECKNCNYSLICDSVQV